MFLQHIVLIMVKLKNMNFICLFIFDKNWEIASNFYDLVYENNLIKSIKPKAIKSPNKLYQISEPLIPLNIQEVNISDNWKDFDFNNFKI
ncbi:Uncharacterised protein (plasmid) [Mesomycoplasma conjunctivae]|nr:Uncharacterised protein [Mesomycoplasma conjunctivae]